MGDRDASKSAGAGAPHRFAPTRWSLVMDARCDDPGTSERAMAELCQSYWFPLYGFIRRQGYSPEDAEDLTQGLFEQLLRLDTFARADERKGKLRTFLLGALKKYLANEHARANAVKRGGGKTTISLDREWAENQIKLEPADSAGDPSIQYERRWAMTLLRTSIRSLEESYRERGAGEKFKVLEPFLLWNTDDDYQKAADTLSQSLGATKVAIHRLRKQFREIARKELSDTLADGEDIDQELQHVFAALS